MITKQAQSPITIPFGPALLDWFAITPEQAERDAQSLRARGFQVNEPKYRVKILIDPNTQAALLQKLAQGVTEWMNANPAFGQVQLQKDLQAGADPAFPNHVSIDCKSKFAPHLYYRNEGAAQASQFYRGCVVAVGLCYRYYESGRDRGLTLSAESLQFLQDGVPLGGGGVSPQAALQRLQGMENMQLPPGFNMPQAAPAAQQQQYQQPQYQQPVYSNPGPGLQPTYNQPQYAGQTQSQGGL